MTPRTWPVKYWAIYLGDASRVAFLVDEAGKPTVPALFLTRKLALAAINKRPGMKPLRVDVTVEAVRP